MTGRYLKALIIITLLMAGNSAWAASSQMPNRSDVVFVYSNKIFSDVDPKDAVAAMNIYVGEIARQAGIPATSYASDELAEIIGKIKNGSVDFLSLATDDYFRIKDQIDIDAAITRVKAGKKTVKYLLLTNQHRGFRKLSELKSKTIMLPMGDEFAAMYLDTLLMKDRWGERKTFFSSIIETAKPSQAALAVFFGQADACVITDISFATVVEMNPQLGKSLQTLASSSELITTVAAFRKGVNSDIRQKVTYIGTHLRDNPRGRQVLMLFKIDGMISIKDADLADTRALVNNYNRLRSGRH